MSYFDGIQVGDKIFTMEEGDVEVQKVSADIAFYAGYWYNMNGVIAHGEKNYSQTAFWSKPEIIAPPRPKRIATKELNGWAVRNEDGTFLFYEGGSLVGVKATLIIEVEE